MTIASGRRAAAASAAHRSAKTPNTVGPDPVTRAASAPASSSAARRSASSGRSDSAAALEPCRDRDALVDRQAQRRGGRLGAERVERAADEVGPVDTRAHDLVGVGGLRVHLVVELQRREQRAEVVETVRAAGPDVQNEVELRRRGLGPHRAARRPRSDAARARKSSGDSVSHAFSDITRTSGLIVCSVSV